jgi:SpoIIAA-like
MIEILEGFPANVVAARAGGDVTRHDYEAILMPKVAAVAKSHPKLRCYYELGPDFTGMAPGAMWDDFLIGVEYLTRWERIAAVTDIAWIAHALNAFGFLMPGRVRVFGTRDKETARAWVAAP